MGIKGNQESGNQVQSQRVLYLKCKILYEINYRANVFVPSDIHIRTFFGCHAFQDYGSLITIIGDEHYVEINKKEQMFFCIYTHA